MRCQALGLQSEGAVMNPKQLGVIALKSLAVIAAIVFLLGVIIKMPKWTFNQTLFTSGWTDYVNQYVQDPATANMDTSPNMLIACVPFIAALLMAVVVYERVIRAGKPKILKFWQKLVGVIFLGWVAWNYGYVLGYSYITKGWVSFDDYWSSLPYIWYGSAYLVITIAAMLYCYSIKSAPRWSRQLRSFWTKIQFSHDVTSARQSEADDVRSVEAHPAAS